MSCGKGYEHLLRFPCSQSHFVRLHSSEIIIISPKNLVVIDSDIFIYISMLVTWQIFATAMELSNLKVPVGGHRNALHI